MAPPVQKNPLAISRRRLWGTLLSATFFRLVINTARRFAYPFAPALARGLGVELTAVTSLIAVNQATALLGLLCGPLADRLGYRIMILGGLAVLAVGMLAAAIFPTYGVVMGALFLAGLGKIAFDPAIQAFVGEKIAYGRRAMAIGILEFSWAGSSLLGIPLLGICMDRFGWRSPFFIFGGLGMVGFLVLWMLVPGQSHGRHAPPTQSAHSLLGSAFKELMGVRAARGALGYAFFISLANDNLFVVYGAWLEQDFGVRLVTLGVCTAAIGVAELAGEGLTALFSDRMGLRRSLMVGLGLCTVSYLLLPLLTSRIETALAGLFLIFLTFEFTVVTSISLCTEMVPRFRATMMSCFFAAAGAGRVIGALLGGGVWLMGGLAATATVSALFSALGMACLIWGLTGGELGDNHPSR